MNSTWILLKWAFRIIGVTTLICWVLYVLAKIQYV